MLTALRQGVAEENQNRTHAQSITKGLWGCVSWGESKQQIGEGKDSGGWAARTKENTCKAKGSTNKEQKAEEK